MVERKYSSIDFRNVEITGGFWKQKQEINAHKTIQAVYDRSKETGRIDAFRLDWKPGMTPMPHKFWDSDVAKWMEAAAYSLVKRPDENIRKLLDEVIDLIVKAQQPDGYINIVFTVVHPENRWKNLRDDHELYCAGHLMEAAVAVSQYLDDDILLKAMEKYADYIASVFGREDGKLRGYPGHQEIELALVRLYHHTKNRKYLELAEYFVNERGEDPYYFDEELKARGLPIPDRSYLSQGGISIPHDWLYSQSHLLAREQDEAFGHSVRACYFYSGMADIAMEYDDEELLDACHLIWEDIALRKMYITGGIGSTHRNEGWTYPYDLPNDTAYAETCAAIAWIYFNHRLSQSEINGKYGDMMERAFYNGFLSGISIDGEKFFYVNPLEVNPESGENKAKHTFPERQKFFGCSCCPPNVARLIGSVGNYLYNQNESNIIVNLYANSKSTFNNGMIIEQHTDYPWSSNIEMNIIKPADNDGIVNLFVRIPSWCEKPSIELNGESLKINRDNDSIKQGYVKISKNWKEGDNITIDLPMNPKFIHANPRVSDCMGKVAIQRGPIVYAFEENDNAIPDFRTVFVNTNFPIKEKTMEIMGQDCIAIEAKGQIYDVEWDDVLYQEIQSKFKETELLGIPYHLWANRGKGAMAVWLKEIKQ